MKESNKQRLERLLVRAEVANTLLSRSAKSRDRDYKTLLKEHIDLQREFEALTQVKALHGSVKIPYYQWANTSNEGTAVIVASDWHIEEKIPADTMNGLNEFDMAIAERRAARFWQVALRLRDVFKKDIPIKNMVVALLGDFISGSIHEELLENCSLRPVEAAIKAKEMLKSGLDFLLRESDLTITCVCHVGNHSRMTKKVRSTTEVGNSLELFIYHALNEDFARNPRIKFLVAKGYHSYVQVYDKVLRFSHGHAVHYYGGLGGLFIPAYRAIGLWNEAKHADLDCWGHHHTTRDGFYFLCNGCLNGYNPYAIRLRGSYESPRQLFFLMDKRRGRTITAPILLEG